MLGEDLGTGEGARLLVPLGVGRPTRPRQAHRLTGIFGHGLGPRVPYIQSDSQYYSEAVMRGWNFSAGTKDFDGLVSWRALTQPTRLGRTQ